MAVPTPVGGAGAAAPTPAAAPTSAVEERTLKDNIKYTIYVNPTADALARLRDQYNFTMLGNILIFAYEDNIENPLFVFTLELNLELNICELWNFKRHDRAAKIKRNTTGLLVEIFSQMNLFRFNIWLGVIEPKLVANYEANGFVRIDGYDNTMYSPLGNTIGIHMVSMTHHTLGFQEKRFNIAHYPEYKQLPILLNFDQSIINHIVNRYVYNPHVEEVTCIFYIKSAHGKSGIPLKIEWTPYNSFKPSESFEFSSKGGFLIDRKSSSSTIDIKMYTPEIMVNPKYISAHTHPMSTYIANSESESILLLIQPPSTSDIYHCIMNRLDVHFVFTMEGVYSININLQNILSLTQKDIDSIKSQYQTYCEYLFPYGKEFLNKHIECLRLKYRGDQNQILNVLNVIRAKDIQTFCSLVNKIRPDIFQIQFFVYTITSAANGTKIYGLDTSIHKIHNFGSRTLLTEEEIAQFKTVTGALPVTTIDKHMYDEWVKAYSILEPISNSHFSHIQQFLNMGVLSDCDAILATYGRGVGTGVAGAVVPSGAGGRMNLENNGFSGGAVRPKRRRTVKRKTKGKRTYKNRK
jgi:hypothetical protein